LSKGRATYLLAAITRKSSEPGDRQREDVLVEGPMQGVRILELAQFTFVPASGAVLADWGADVIKVEHVETGDAQRALVNIMGLDTFTPTEFFPIMEAPNRGKRSIGLDLASEGGRRVLEALIAKADVFVTNFREETRRKLRIDVADVRAINPDIIYFRGTGQGVRGADGPLGGYDQTSFWARTGIAESISPPELGRIIPMPTGAFGDNIGGMTIAGGIAAALYRRAVTGEPSVIDVSLLSVGMWAASYGINHSLLLGEPLPPVPAMSNGSPRNPLSGGPYRTKDNRFLQMGMLQPGKYWPEVLGRLGRDDLVADERFNTAERLMANAEAAAAELATVIADITLDEWRAAMQGAQGQWALIQNYLEAGNDPQARDNGYVRTVTDHTGVERELVTNPVQFDETPPDLTRAPQFAEHTDEILRELGFDDEELIALKIAGAVT
jgi:crotonobetainyl-CoA:carnitine CoA-transferase CaiB-like acyl-CoA transferase